MSPGSSSFSTGISEAWRGGDRVPPHVLLVSRSAAWMSAVQDAATHLGGKTSLAHGGRDALNRLTKAHPRYSHLLVDQADAEGLFHALADLAREAAGLNAGMFVLGGQPVPDQCMRAVPVASTGSVIEALTTWSAVPVVPPAIELLELRAALDGARIETRYQPIVRLADRQPVAIETLARLNHPLQGVVQPDRFIPMLEDAGLADRLTDLVCVRALSDMASGSLMGQGFSLALNFPLDVLLHPAALQCLEAQRTAAGIASTRIIIELTESRPVEDFATLGRSLEILRAHGYRIAIDDVGPAVPRLAPLLDLPFTSLKLDKSLIQSLKTNADVREFVVRTIAAAKARGLTVVVEGVETGDIWQVVAAMGADEAQGFLVARPLPLAAVPVWLDHWSEPDQG